LKHLVEIDMKGKRVSPRTVIYPTEAMGLTDVLTAGDVRQDFLESLWPAYVEILKEMETWDDGCLPFILPDDATRVPEDETKGHHVH
jgi:hypothetical protein